MPEQSTDLHRDSRGILALDELFQDLRYALRTFGKDPAFAFVAVLILALGIGANVAVFSVVNTLLLRPLPFPQSEQLVWFMGNRGEGGLSGVTYNGIPLPDRRHAVCDGVPGGRDSEGLKHRNTFSS